jgi:histidine triad (HIT) family protein
MELTVEQKAAIEQQKEHCPFCQIVAGKIPARKVYEDGKLLAILDINPAKKGHVLLLPKEHYPIMPLIPKDTFVALTAAARDITKHLREAVLASHSTVFIANGQAAGQQSTHFLLHIIPSDKQLFKLPEKEMPKSNELAGMLRHNLPLMLKERAKRFPLEAPQENAADRLADLIASNPEFRKMLEDKPEAVLAGLDDNPSLKPLFEGVDVHALSERLRQETASKNKPNAPEALSSDIPRATDLDDKQLVAFLDSKEKLRDLLLNDIDALKVAIPEQERLVRFLVVARPKRCSAATCALAEGFSNESCLRGRRGARFHP